MEAIGDPIKLINILKATKDIEKSKVYLVKIINNLVKTPINKDNEAFVLFTQILFSEYDRDISELQKELQKTFLSNVSPHLSKLDATDSAEILSSLMYYHDTGLSSTLQLLGENIFQSLPTQKDLAHDILKEKLTKKPDLFKNVNLENIKYIKQLDVLKLHKSKELNDEQYKAFVDSLGDEAINPSLRFEITTKLAPEVEGFITKLTTSKSVGADKINLIATKLTELVSKEDSMSAIYKAILKAASLPGEILLYRDEVISGGDVCDGYNNITGDVAFTGLIDRVIDTIIHELTHKLMRFLFKNTTKPYYSDNTAASSALDEIIKEIQKDGKLKDNLLFDYTADKLPSEIIAFYLGEMAGKAVDPDYRKGKTSITISEKFAQWFKDYAGPVIEKFSVAIDYLKSSDVQKYSEQQELRFEKWTTEQISKKHVTILEKVQEKFGDEVHNYIGKNYDLDMASFASQMDSGSIKVAGDEISFEF